VTIIVRRSGLLTTIQDLGRYGYQRVGVSVSGAMDPYASLCANLLVGNERTAPLLELTVTGPSLTFTEPTVIAICGADMKPVVQGKRVPMWRPVYVPADTTIEFGTARQGVRAYVAFAGGLQLERRMGSYSTYLMAGFGGYDGRALREGDRLPVGEPSPLGKELAAYLMDASARSEYGEWKQHHVLSPAWQVGSSAMPRYAPDPIVRFIRGIHYTWFDASSVEALTISRYRLTPQSDRMGCRLCGRKLQIKDSHVLLSEAVTAGTVQVPPDGQPIILMADRQTTGGYPVIAQVISADLPVVAQTPIGGQISFVEVSLEEAQRLWIQMHKELQLVAAGMRAYMKSGRR